MEIIYEKHLGVFNWYERKELVLLSLQFFSLQLLTSWLHNSKLGFYLRK